MSTPKEKQIKYAMKHTRTHMILTADQTSMNLELGRNTGNEGIILKLLLPIMQQLLFASLMSF